MTVSRTGSRRNISQIMKFKTLVLVTCIMLQHVCLLCGIELKTYGRRWAGKRIIDSYIWRQKIVSSLSVCAGMCSVETGCFTISFYHDGKTCLISKRWALYEMPSMHMTDSPGWTTMFLKEFTVYNRMGPGGHYAVPFSDAASICEQENTTLASTADLLQSRTMGLNFCFCGWMSDGADGLAGFVLQRRSNCYPVFHDNVIYCPDWLVRANVWCRF